ncbi:hypothetical protein PSA7680_00802 [Pseudoruegeria aquimaris]|uniref:Lipid/polyisoprenoid-binding YceI-like domain-containing protein n=1 Tax=Pseudoruegeria aquimaris TaxID=393663 RepID=A0A1Y5RPW5_9RHOB|nr:cytochrome b/b6 domain-containing protein [Pseudoruegeria aquimaris]SLN21579.1 hypothetical protein PSA7680_00802 [Pseudoruegeria aquimaris]
MPTTNTADSYGSISKAFHWITALLILTAFPIGQIANGLPFDTGEQLARKAWLFSLHKTLGVTVFFVALARLAWTATQRRPLPLHPEKRAETFLAEAVHVLLYLSLVFVPLSGWLHHAATEGFAPIWWPFGQSLPFVPKNEALAHLFSGWHEVLTKVLLLAFLLHLAGALKHAVIDKDDTLRRMSPGAAPRGPAPAAGRHSRAPALAAVAAYAAALLAASALSWPQAGPQAAPAPAAQTSARPAGNWQVESGTLALTVTQFGKPVKGAFSDWSATIDFDETVQDGLAGSVEVSVRIPSLTLGGVTEQAMGPDFFDAERFPTALYSADILALGDGQYDAVGTLALRGVEAPLDLPFTLRVEEGRAEMEATVRTDRRDFGIGANLPDEQTLAFGVEIKVDLVARKAP